MPRLVLVTKLRMGTRPGAVAAQALLTHGADPQLRKPPDGLTPLYLACQHGHLSVAKLLIEQHSADPVSAGPPRLLRRCG